MTKRTIWAMVIVSLIAAAAFADEKQNPFIGTWKLNPSKSKLPAWGIKRSTATYQAIGDQIKVTVDEGTSDNTVHMEWIGKFDGQDYPVTGTRGATWSYKLTNDYVAIFTIKKGNKVVTLLMTISADGKTRTNTGTVTDANGKEVSVAGVYEKQ